jgi:hypothetical protein
MHVGPFFSSSTSARILYNQTASQVASVKDLYSDFVDN